MLQTAGTGVLAALGAAACARIGPGEALSVAAPLDTVEVIPGLHIHPRSVWGSDLPPTGPLTPETVDFLLVHHTASPNTYASTRRLIRSVYWYQTGPAKRWPDVCYQFFVGRDGSIWEGRAGSIDGPVRADATGGNQGWAQLVCLLGTYTREAPTAAAQASLVRLLAWLAHRYRLDTDPAATTTYRSRGSNLHRDGELVTTPVISGHRDASATTCPGDAAYRLLPDWRRAVADVPPPEFPQPGPHPQAERLGRVDLGWPEPTPP